MQNVFVSFHFSDDFDSPDRLLVNRMEGLLRSHGLVAVNGEALGGGPLTDKIKGLIEKSDALIALMTRREQKDDGSWNTHQWVQDEYGHARSKNMRTIALIEKGVSTGGMYQHNEYISYNPDDCLAAFLRLSATIGVWKRELGRPVKLLIQPNQIAQNYGNNAEWKYRFNVNGVLSNWQDVSLSREPGGCYLYLPNVPDDALIQIQARTRNSCAESIYTPQWVVVNLEET
ncbi:MAG: hypothetical protein FJ264_16090 [Planctomycetes bacterium]|nr:hypothetical protein [Planctomycetota bacterium]